MANYKRQYSTIYQHKDSEIAKYVRDFDANHGYISRIYPNHYPLFESLRLCMVNYKGKY